jgi:predicted porin
MKKTIVAAAIAAAVAAPAAMAEVSVSGQINMEWTKTENATASLNNDLGGDLNTDVFFKGSEDLGNGMKAGFVIGVSPDGAAAAHAWDDQYLTLSGDFGSIKMGQHELFIENAVNAIAANDASDSLGNEVTGNTGERAGNSLEYTSPSFSGAKLVLSARGSATTNDGDFDGQGVGIDYSNGGLTVRAAQFDGVSVSTALTPSSTKTEETSVAVKYTMGDFTVAAANAEVKTTSTKTDESWFGVSYKMGNNTISASTRSSEGTSGDDDTFSVKHAMSKQTSVGITFVNAQAANSDKAAITVAHSF